MTCPDFGHNRRMYVYNALYADDIELVGKDAMGLQELLAVAEEYARVSGYRFNVSKCAAFSDTSLVLHELNDFFLNNLFTSKAITIKFGREEFKLANWLQRSPDV